VESAKRADGKGLISPAQRQSVGPIAAAMRVFHTWIGDGDRKTDHVFVNLDSPSGHLDVAFFDHGNSMSSSWGGPNANCPVCPHYLPGVPEDRPAMIETAEYIAALADADVQRLIDRIPTAYLPMAPRGHILQNLLARKRNLQAILGI
jgi:hypothetical protein